MADERLTKLANDLVPILRRKLGTLQIAGTGGGVSGGGDPGEHAHPEYLTQDEADLLYVALSTYVAHAANAGAHHPQQHAILGSDHTIVAAAMRILGTPTTANTLGLFVAGSDGSGGNVVLVTDANGDITVGVVNADELNVTDLTADNIVANVSVTTPKITSDDDLLIDPTNDLQLRPTGDILFSGRILSDALIGGDPAIYIDPETGLVDAEVLQAKEAVFDAVIAAAKRAEAGAIEITRSFAFLARAFTIPAEGATSVMYVSELESLPGYDPLGEGNIVKIPFFQAGGELQVPTTIEGSVADDATGTEAGSGSPTEYYDNDFTAGAMTSLFQTGANNSLSAAGFTVADIYADSGNNTLRVETNEANCHVHFSGANAGDLTDYVFTGRFKPLAAGVGIGFTVYSKYWGSVQSDTYYRVRRYGTGSASTFHLANHGSGYSMTGTTTTSYDPGDNLNVWHKFKVQVEDDGASGTRIRARFWLDGASEPGTWAIDCHDAATVLDKGTFGLWMYQGGPNNLLYDDLHVESISGTAPGIDTALTLDVPEATEHNDILLMVATCASGATLGTPSGWTLLQTATVGSVSSRLYHRRWQTGNARQVTLALDTPDELFARIIAIRGVKTGGQRSAATTASTTNPQPPSIAVTKNGLHVALFCRHNGTNIVLSSSAPTGYTGAGTASSTSYAHKHYSKLFDAAGTASASWPAFTVGTAWGVFSYAVDPEDATTVPFYVGAAWGTVTKSDPQPGDVTVEEVAYDFTMLGSYRSEGGQQSPAVGRTAQIDALVQDYGPTTGDSYIIATVLDRTGSPYIRLARHTGFNSSTGRLNVRILGQFGSLSGLGADFESGENGIVMYADDDRRRTFLTTLQMLLDGVDSYWRDDDGNLIASITDAAGFTMHAQETETDAGLAAGERNITFVDADGNVVAGLFYASFAPANPILPEGQRLAMRVTGDGVDGVDADVVASNTDGTRAARSALRAYSDTHESAAVLEQQGASSVFDIEADRMAVLGGVTIAHGRTAAEVAADWNHNSNVIYQGHNGMGGSGAWVFSNVGGTDVDFVVSASSPAVDRIISGRAVVYNRTDNTVTSWEFTCNKSATTTRTVGDSNVTIGVSATGRAYIKRSSGTSNFDVSLMAVWL